MLKASLQLHIHRCVLRFTEIPNTTTFIDIENIKTCIALQTIATARILVENFGVSTN